MAGRWLAGSGRPGAGSRSPPDSGIGVTPPSPRGNPAETATREVGHTAKIDAGIGPGRPQVVTLFGATGDLARRKLLPGLLHVVRYVPEYRIVAVSLDDMTADEFREHARSAVEAFYSRGVSPQEWEQFSRRLDYVSTRETPEALAVAVKRALGSSTMTLRCCTISAFRRRPR